MSKPLDETVRAEIVRLAKTGMTRNAIAEQIGCSPATVSRWAHRAGHEFDRNATESATQAKQADMRAKRASIAAGALDRAGEIVAKLALATDPKALQLLALAFASMARGHSELMKLDPHMGESAEEVRSALRDFITGVKERAKDIESAQCRRDTLKQHRQPAIETGQEQDEQ